MKFLMTAAIAALAAAPLAAQTAQQAQPAAGQAAAPAQPQLAAGTTVYDPQGGVVGTIEAVAGDAVTLSLGTTKVNLPKASFGTTEKGTAIGMTRAELEAAAQSAAASASANLQSQLVAGAQIFGETGTTPVGTVKEADAQFVTVTTAKGDVRLPVAAFASRQGKIVIGMSAAEFDAAVSGSAGATAGAAPGAGAAATTDTATEASADTAQ